MTRGIVRRFSREKGYGFILPVNSADVFVHCTDILGEDWALHKGQECTFDVKQSPKGLHALKVVPGRTEPDSTMSGATHCSLRVERVRS